MIGIFDSGKGGLFALEELRLLKPKVDICFFADRKNAPYGKKTKEELIALATSDIKRLVKFGADKILIACCTASTVWEYLPSEYKSITTPIITPTAAAALGATKNKRIGVIATEATVKSGEFTKSLVSLDNKVTVFEKQTQDFVAMVESGEADINSIRENLLPFSLVGIDTLILGCTHFSHLKKEISLTLPGVALISSSYEGALKIAKDTENIGQGKTYYL